MTYDPKNWFWIVAGDATQAYSSARRAYVPANDADYLAFQETHLASIALDAAELDAILLRDYPAGRIDAVTYIPVKTVVDRLEAAGKLDDVAALLSPGQLVKFLTLSEGVAENDPDVTALLNAVGADPSVILAI